MYSSFGAERLSLIFSILILYYDMPVDRFDVGQLRDVVPAGVGQSLINTFVTWDSVYWSDDEELSLLFLPVTSFYYTGVPGEF